MIMKRLILPIVLICFFALPVYAFNPMVVCGGGVEAGASCTVDNDSELDNTGWDTHAGNITNPYVCSEVTLSAQSTITQYIIGIYDGGGDAGSEIASLWTDGTNEPGSLIDNSSKTIAMTSIGPTTEAVVFVLDTPLTAQPSGTYWVCVQESGGSAHFVTYDGTGESGERICYDTDGVGPWACNADVALGVGIYGCED